MSSSSSASFLSPHTVIFSPQIRPASPHQPPKTYNILFCPGNPGCIAYYHAFLAHFAEILASPAPLPSSSKLSTASTTSSPSASSTASTNASFNISASSFPNFVDDDDDETARNDGQKRPTGKLLDLSSLISHVYDQHLLSPPPHTDPTATPANTTPANTTSQETEKTLILIGHSVGAYIVMELLRRWLDEKKKKKERGQGTEGGGQVRVVGVIGLWPTIVSIGQSKRGKWARILLLLPSLPLLISLLAHALVYILGPSGVEWLVKHITGFSDDAVKTTAGFVGSRRGVRQAV
ncbi:hypothetical protein MMC20_002804 [Loxospora ochrophaea]|nr:hypothetical protein [Loxospora ochrophaea]